MSRKKRKDIYRDYSERLNAYLFSKLPDLPFATVLEISEHVTSMTAVLMADVIRERDKQWDSYCSKTATSINNSFERLKERLRG